MHAHIKKRRFWFIIALVLLIIVGTMYVYIKSAVFMSTPDSLIVGVDDESTSLVLIAVDQGFFAANGLNITLKNYQTGLAAVNGMLEGECNISAASEFVLVNEAIQNVSVSTIGSISSGRVLYLVANSDKGIVSISDLRGKTIGVQLGTFAEFYLGRFLDLNGISQKQVTLANIAFSQLPNALVNGTVDAIITSQLGVNQAQNLLDNKTIVWAAQAGQPAYDEVICTNSWISLNPGLIVKFLKALAQAEIYTVKQPTEAMAIVAKELNYTKPYMASVWGNYQFLLSLDQSQVLLMEDEARWLVSNNLTNITTTPIILNHIYPDGLKAVKPEAVNIIS